MSGDDDLCIVQDSIELVPASDAFPAGANDGLILSPPLAQASTVINPSTPQETSLTIREFPLLAIADPESFHREAQLIERAGMFPLNNSFRPLTMSVVQLSSHDNSPSNRRVKMRRPTTTVSCAITT